MRFAGFPRLSFLLRTLYLYLNLVGNPTIAQQNPTCQCSSEPLTDGYALTPITQNCVRVRRDNICSYSDCCWMDAQRVEIFLAPGQRSNVLSVYDLSGAPTSFDINNDTIRIADISIGAEYCVDFQNGIDIISACNGVCTYSFIDAFGVCCPYGNFSNYSILPSPPTPPPPRLPPPPKSPPPRSPPPPPKYSPPPPFRPEVPYEPYFPLAPQTPTPTPSPMTQRPSPPPKSPSPKPPTPQTPDPPYDPYFPLDPQSPPPPNPRLPSPPPPKPSPPKPKAPYIPQPPFRPEVPYEPYFPLGPKLPQPPRPQSPPPPSKSPQQPPPSPTQPSFPYCKCSRVKTSQIRLTYAYQHASYPDTYCFLAYLYTELPCSSNFEKCCNYDIYKIEFNISNPTCTSSIAFFLVDGIKKSPSITRYPMPVAKLISSIPIIPSMNPQPNSQNEICVAFRKPCPSLSDFCSGESCSYALFNFDKDCCVYGITP